MIETKANDLLVGDEFTMDDGETWYQVMEVDTHEVSKMKLPSGKIHVRARKCSFGGCLAPTRFAFDPRVVVIVR